ncbi:MAG: class I SAM-dependent methyltransferase [Candidatus Aenigmarchaeota archaeon]|nr:class I SAM-dependent methyltransferase [Candidatus Aenigmarchaeota archaeon]
MGNHLYKTKSKYQPVIPEVDISELVPEPIAIEIHHPTVSDGNVSLFELMVINKLIRYHNPSKIFEIGTFDGRTTLNISANSTGKARILTLDLPREKIGYTRLPIDSGDTIYIEKNMSGEKFVGTSYQNKIEQVLGDSASFDFTPFLDSFDWVFIDGAHSYEYVVNDSNIARKLLRNGKGVIVWHDYEVKQGVTRALNELFSGQSWAGGLKRIAGTSLVCLITE